MYIETSAPRVNGDKARFLSQTFPPTNNSACMSFYYHMYGAEIGKLSVILLTNTSADSATTEAMLWQVTGDNGNSWNQGQVNIPRQYTAIPYQMVFEGVRGTGYRGDIGLDDISFDFTTGCQTVPSYAGSSQTGESLKYKKGHVEIISMCTFAILVQYARIAVSVQCSILATNRNHCLGESAKVNDGVIIIKRQFTCAAEHWCNLCTNLHIARLLQSNLPACLSVFGSVSLVKCICSFVCMRLSFLNNVCPFLCLYVNIWWIYIDIVLSSVFKLNIFCHCQIALALFVCMLKFSSDWVYFCNDICPSICVSVSLFTLLSAKWCLSNAWQWILTKYLLRPLFMGHRLKIKLSVLGPNSVYCNFDTDLCQWTQSKNDTFDWTSNNGSTPSVGTGPTADHTGVGGKINKAVIWQKRSENWCVKEYLSNFR